MDVPYENNFLLKLDICYEMTIAGFFLLIMSTRKVIFSLKKEKLCKDKILLKP